jgi:type VI secretion system Hcp family effector
MVTIQRMAREARSRVALAVGMLVSVICMATPFQRVAAADEALTATVLIEGVQGSKEDGSIPILSFRAGITRSAASGSLGSGGSAQRPEFSDIAITKVLDETSPLLSLMAATGKQFKSVTLTFYNEAQQRYFEILLEDVLISGVQTTEGVMGTRPIEAVTFAFNRIIWTAVPNGEGQNPIIGGWDVRSNSAL